MKSFSQTIETLVEGAMPAGSVIKLSRMLRAIYPRLKEADDTTLRHFIETAKVYQARFVRPTGNKSYSSIDIQLKGKNKANAFIRDVKKKTGHLPAKTVINSGKIIVLEYNPRDFTRGM